MKPRAPQQALRFGASNAAESADAWCDGTTLPYLGGAIAVHLVTDRKQAVLDGTTLHLPLPPEASPRQIQDAAEAWLRREAQQLLAASIDRLAAQLRAAPPRLALSFAARGHWVVPEAGCLRCNWRLIEQPAAVIDQVLSRALASLPSDTVSGDLFGALG